MRELGINGSRGHRRVLPNIGLLAAITAFGAASAVEGCGGETTPGTSATSTSAGGGSSSATASGTGGGTGGASVTTTSVASSSSSTTGGTGGSGGSGGGTGCGTTAAGPSHGSAIAVSPDDTRVVTVNRDAGTVTIMAVDYTDGQPKMTSLGEIKIGGEPWQVVIDACGSTAYVVLRKDQKVVRIDAIDSLTPKKGAEASTGSEPTSLALTPNGKKLYVSNWVDGTLTVIDPNTMATLTTVNLNPVLVDTGALGTVTSRSGLAHPRALAITSNGDGSDDDETVYATEWFASRTGPETATGTGSDTNWKGLVYTPDDTLNDSSAAPGAGSLSKKTWNTTLNGFPSSLFPVDPASATFAADANMRFGLAPGAEQIQCILRPVGTIGPIVMGVPGGISDPAVNVLELRQDMVTGAQGAAPTGRGFNPPSLLGISVGAPYFHAGNARTLEEAFSTLFVKHYQSAVANIFNPDATQVKQLVSYVLSIDEDAAVFAIPAKGNSGGDLCF